MLKRNVVQRTTKAPVLQYLTGSQLITWRNLGERDWRARLAGLSIEVGRYGDEFDRFLHQQGYARIEIEHKRHNAKPVIAQHWWFGDELAVFPLTAGPTIGSVAGLLKRQQEAIDAGIGVRWPEGEGSALAVRGYVRALLEAGWDQPVQLTTHRNMTDYMLAALVRHIEAAELADELARKKAQDPNAFVSPVELAWVIGVGEPTDVGKAQSSRVRPVVCVHPKAMDRQYLASIYAAGNLRAVLQSAVERDWQGTVAWAAEFARGQQQDTPEPEPQSRGAYEDEEDIPF